MTKPVLYIVDDEQDYCETMAATFSSEKFDIRTYSNPADFLNEFDGSVAGCLLLDNRMPLITGIQILEKIRHWLPVFPVFLVTGYADVTLAVHAMQIGAYGLIQKPATTESIVDQVESAIEKYTTVRKKYKEAS